MNENKEKWTDEVVSELLDLTREQGLSASLAAEALTNKFGVTYTRGSVIGKLDRMKMSTQPKVKKKPVFKGRKVKPKAQLHPVTFAGVTIGFSSEPAIAVVAEPFQEEDAPRPLAIYEMRRHNQCRYHLQDQVNEEGHQLFCGRTTEDGPWCREHRKRVFAERVRP